MSDREQAEKWRQNLLRCWAKDARATMTALLEDGPDYEVIEDLPEPFAAGLIADLLPAKVLADGCDPKPLVQNPCSVPNCTTGIHAHIGHGLGFYNVPISTTEASDDGPEVEILQAVRNGWISEIGGYNLMWSINRNRKGV
jgi:hypothetical protein